MFDGTPDLMVCRMLLPRAAANPGFAMLVLDVTAAFLQADLDDNEVLVVRPPPDVYTGALWKLKRAMHGTRKASNHWDDKKAFVMQDCGFARLQSDGAV